MNKASIKDIKEWQEIPENEADGIMIDELLNQANTFITNVRNKQLSLKEKIKLGAGRKIIVKALDKFSNEFFENSVLTRGMKKFRRTLDKKKVLEFKEFYLKKEEGKYFLSKNKL